MEQNPAQLYVNATKADAAFSQAIRAQYGPQATRWDAHPEPYNEATQAVFEAKVRADLLWRRCA